MPITPFLQNQAFEPEQIEAMSDALTRVRLSLGLTERADPVIELVAGHTSSGRKWACRLPTRSIAIRCASSNRIESRPPQSAGTARSAVSGRSCRFIFNFSISGKRALHAEMVFLPSGDRNGQAGANGYLRGFCAVRPRLPAACAIGDPQGRRRETATAGPPIPGEGRQT